MTMKIKIAQRLRPFSHQPGVKCLIPGSFYAVEVFPARVNVYDVKGPVPILTSVLTPAIVGPVVGFTVQQDLEAGCVCIWGTARNGYFRYRLECDPMTHSLTLQPLRGSLQWDFSLPQCNLIEKTKKAPKQNNFEQLSLGVERAQEWQGIHARGDLREILPYWYRLGQSLPALSSAPWQGTAELLYLCQDALHAGNLVMVPQTFKQLFTAAFKDLFYPDLQDSDYQGFSIGDVDPSSSLSPLVVLKEGAAMIRHLFVHFLGGELTPLPHLPPGFPCGRMTGLVLNGIGTLDMEWRKRKIRRMVIRTEAPGELTLALPRQTKSFRLRVGTECQGKRYQRGEVLPLNAGEEYFLDNFAI